MSVQDSVQCFQSIGLYLEKIREISLGAIVKRGELQPVCPEEAQPQLGALAVVMGRKEKAEAVFQPLLFFFSRQYMCNEEGLLVGGVAWQLYLSLAFVLCPGKSAVGVFTWHRFLPTASSHVPFSAVSTAFHLGGSVERAEFCGGCFMEISQAPFLITDVLECDLRVK